MQKFNLLIAVALLLSTALLATPAIKQKAEKDSFDQVIKNCFSNKDWSEADVEIIPAKEYAQGWYDYPASGMSQAVPAVAEGIAATVHYAKSIFSVDYKTLNQYGRMDLFAKYIQWTAKRIPKDELYEFRKGCMVLCVSSSYLTYVERLDTKFSNLGRLVSEQEGVCTEFAKFADDLAGRVGLASRVASNLKMRHAYNTFKLGKKWYYAEPQRDDCEFLDPDLD